MTNSIISRNRLNDRLWQLAAVLLAIAVWQIVARTVNLSILIPTPLMVLKRIKELSAEGSFWRTLLLSAGRIFKGFGMGLLPGIICAAAAAKWKPVEILLKPYVIVMKSVPVAAFIIISLIWLDMERLTAFIVFLMVFPILYSNALEGMKATDNKMMQMAAVYRIPGWKQFVYIQLQSLKPYLISGIRVAIGTAWKAGVAAEVIGLINGSIGANLYDAKIYLMSEDLFAWTVVICVLSVVSENLLYALLQLIYKGLERL